MSALATGMSRDRDTVEGPEKLSVTGLALAVSSPAVRSFLKLLMFTGRITKKLNMTLKRPGLTIVTPFYTAYRYRVTRRLQMVLNAAARLVVGVGKFDHVTPVLRDVLHWLSVPQRI